MSVSDKKIAIGLELLRNMRFYNRGLNKVCRCWNRLLKALPSTIFWSHNLL